MIQSRKNLTIRGSGRTVSQNEGGHYTGTGSGHRGPGESSGHQGRLNRSRAAEKVTEHHRGSGGGRSRRPTASMSDDE